MESNNGYIVRDEMCERQLIATMMVSATAFSIAQDYLDEDCFYFDRHKDAYRALVAMSERGDEFNLLSFAASVKAIGEYTEEEVLYYQGDSIPLFDISKYSVRLTELKMRRSMWYIGQMLSNAGVSETQDIDSVMKALGEGVQGLSEGRRQDAIFTLREAYRSMMQIVGNNVYRHEYSTGTLTGFNEIDRRGGLQRSDLIIIAGDTSNGKTSLALSIALNAIHHDRKVVFYSMEMTKEQLAARLAAVGSEIPASSILYSSNLSKDQLTTLDNIICDEKAINLYFDDSSTSNIDTILNSIRRMKAKHDIDGVIVDYLQILNVNSKTGNAEQAMGDAARRLKNIAKELGIWVMALSQLSRDKENPVPSLAKLRASGQIAEAADVVLLVYRPEIYSRSFPSPFHMLETEGYAMIHCAKGRNIGTFRFIAGFNRETTHFYDVDTVPNMSKHTDDPF